MIIAYRLELFLWVPLLIVILATGAQRGWLIVPLVMSLITGAWEIFVTSTSGVDVIRIDILLALMLVSVVNVLSGLVLVVTGGERGVAAVRFAGVVCLLVPVLAVVGFTSGVYETSQSTARLYEGMRLRFEAAFRDEATQKRVFGNLESSANPWAGYYVAGDADDRVKHLVINDEGRCWLYAAKLFEYPGRATSVTRDTFEGAGIGGAANMRFVLRHEAGARYAATMQFGTWPAATVPMTKANPPRFPQPVPAGGDAVRFLGVFSAPYKETNDSFWLVQVWLWQAGSDVWGRYIHDHFRRGAKRDFLSAEDVRPRCVAACDVLEFKSGRGPVTLKRLSADTWSAKLATSFDEVLLRRGEILPGFLFDLAYTASVKANREWLKADSEAKPMISWDVPAAPAQPAMTAPSRRDSARP
jgi:hypothetical protein